ncbi:hypothetical protein R83H12_00408 [Fibrobacteria bacterium R8-3-H12]
MTAIIAILIGVILLLLVVVFKQIDQIHFYEAHFETLEEFRESIKKEINSQNQEAK